MKVTTKNLGAGLISAALVGCGGGSAPDSKISQPASPSTSSRLSGVVMDGYLTKAKVCLDKNKNSICDSGDGTTVLTDDQGKYQLPIEGNTKGYRILVEAIAGQTVDLDNPNQPISEAFTLESHPSHPQVVSPMTSIIVNMAELSGDSFDAAADKLATELKVDKDRLKSDYVADSHQESKQLHMLARSITRVIQSAQKASKEDNGVTEEFARKGAMKRLASLDVAEIKTKTDVLYQKVQGKSKEERAQEIKKELKKLATEHQKELKIEQADIQGGVVMTTPQAPTQPKGGDVNDASDTFDWAFVSPFNKATDYEYSLDNGVNWQKVTQKPLAVGKDAKAIGHVQVRVAANADKAIKAGKPFKSSKAYTQTLVPAAPSQLDLDDKKNEFRWTNTPSFIRATDYEYSVNGGATWQNATSNPQSVGDIAIASGDLKLRVRASLPSRPAGLIASSTEAMTVTPPKPVAPTLKRISDSTDLFEIDYVTGFDELDDYEIQLNSSASWQALSGNPYSVGNVDIAANSIKVRVKADSTNGREAGYELTITQAFTRQDNKPAAPTGAVVSDALNTFGWTVVTGHNNYTSYEYSLDGGTSFTNVTNNPQTIPDEAYQAGKVCVRVKAIGDNSAGDVLCNNGKPYTKTPPQPGAPKNGVVHDANDTFDWTPVAGFADKAAYEVKIGDIAWTGVTAKPLQLQNQAYAVDSIQVRVKADGSTGRPAGQILKNKTAFTVRPPKPAAPQGLRVDDDANTLDWTSVQGFKYQWSKDNGTNWQAVNIKPINVGDVAIDAGHVHLRVAANSQNGMPEGAVAVTTQAFTKKANLPAPASGSIGEHNTLDWSFVNLKQNYDQPSHYEFTTDKGVSWQDVTSKPQFVGAQAFDKTKVGVRVKANAISGKTNQPSEILWTTGLSGSFKAMQYVLLKDTNTLYSEAWDKKARPQCIAEYNADGTGAPTFWSFVASRYGSPTQVNYGEVLQSVAGLNRCGIHSWTLPDGAEASRLTNREQNSLPAHVKNLLIRKNHFVWAYRTPSQIWYYRNGARASSTFGSGIYAFVKWQLPSGSDLKTKIDTELANIKTCYSSQASQLADATSFFNASLSQTNFATLKANAESKKATLQTLVTNCNTAHSTAQIKLAGLKFEANFAKSRIDADSKDFVKKVAEFETKLNQIGQNNNALAGALAAADFTAKLAQIKQNVAALSAANASLSGAGSANDIRNAAMQLYKALFDVEAIYATTDALKATFTNALNALAAQHSQLKTAMSALLAELNSTVAPSSLTSFRTAAKSGLRRANANQGDRLAQSDATIDGTHFAKLDVLGYYLPKAATYAQGWRCVLDTSISGRNSNRIWSLLQDGLPNGKDAVVYKAGGTGLPTLIGTGGVLETANNNNLCGKSDWKVPDITQFKSLETHTVQGKKTIDPKVFPNHKGFDASYDKRTNDGGIVFFYWSSVSSSSKQTVYAFANKTYDSSDHLSFDVNQKYDADRYFMLGRLVRQDSVTWKYLDGNGLEVTDRTKAKCAKSSNGEIWQIFQDGAADRFKTLAGVNTELATFNSGSGVCGETNWALPSAAELGALIPHDAEVFKNVLPSKIDAFYDVQKYFLTNSVKNNYQILNPKNGVAEVKKYNTDKYLYRFIAK